MTTRVRLDTLLAQRGLFPSRARAAASVMAGEVRLGPGHARAAKPGQMVASDAVIEVDEAPRFVSRGGIKLTNALTELGVDPAGRHALDVGASTGGFTDCLLQAGAKHVVGADVGHDQLHAQLRCDPAVTAIEGINCRALTAVDLGKAFPPGGFDLIVGDLSFISLTLVLPQLPPLLAAGGDMLLLVKPQFEVGPGNVGKGGIVRDAARYGEVEAKLRQCAAQLGLAVKAWLDSPITGGDGNREFFIWLNK